MAEKPRNRDTVLSDYLRMRIQEWEKSDREQKELAALCGFKSPSTISMVKKGQGVGAKTSEGFARGFGFQSVDAMRHFEPLYIRTCPERDGSVLSAYCPDG